MLKAIEIECPNWHCKAPIGQPCTTGWYEKKRVMKTLFHTRRENAAKRISPAKQLNLF